VTGLTANIIINCNFGTKRGYFSFSVINKKLGEEKMKLKIKIKIKSKIYLKELEKQDQEQPYPLRLAS
jgi:hypothetical protein